MNGLIDRELRVLSIQSHVVHGYVGNKCASFPLELAGFEVDTINSVQFSNHTGYGKWSGEVLPSDQLWKLYEGLCTNSLDEYSHVLTGYTRSAECLMEIARIVTDLRNKNSNLIYICDPVMGDNGKFYVDQKVVPIYQDHIIPLADVMTPNQFELETLTGIKIATEEDILTATTLLHNRGVRILVLTSMNGQDAATSLVGYGSQLMPDKTIQVYRYEVPRIDAYFVGTGDLFTSSLLLWLHRTNNCLQVALEKVLSTLQDVLKRTLDHAKCRRGSAKLTSKDLELRLIQSKDDLLCPKSSVKVVQLASRHLA